MVVRVPFAFRPPRFLPFPPSTFKVID